MNSEVRIEKKQDEWLIAQVVWDRKKKQGKREEKATG